MFHLITCIVERGKADKVVNEALKAGAHAATMYDARGRGIREKLGAAGKRINPKKEVILIVTDSVKTPIVFDVVIAAAKLKEPGRGIAYTQEVDNVMGLIEP
jgi:nitrogen regulatory protein PII